MSSNFQKIPLIKGSSSKLRKRKEIRYWKSYNDVICLKELYPIEEIKFCKQYHHIMAYCSGTRALIYDCKNSKLLHSYTHSKESIKSIALRNDGKLLATGNKEGFIHVNQVQTKFILRTFKKHKNVVNSLQFGFDNISLASCSDDLSIKLWKFDNDSPVINIENAHNDYVKKILFLENNLLASGGYDKLIKIWDLRAQEKETITFNTGKEVENMCLINSNTLASISANLIKIWDLRNNKSLKTIHNHEKSILTIAYDSHTKQIITAGLDSLLKFHYLNEDRPVHLIKFPSEITSFALSEDSAHYCVGLNDGNLLIRSKKKQTEIAGGDEDPYELNFSGKKVRTAKDYRYFHRGQYSKPFEGEIQVPKTKKIELEKYEKLMKKFEYKESLSCCIEENMNKPDVVVSLMQELKERNTIFLALTHMKKAELKQVLNFLIKWMECHKYQDFLIEILNSILELYSCILGLDKEVDAGFARLQQTLTREIQTEKKLLELKAKIEIIGDLSILA